MTLLAYVLDANDDQPLLMACEGHGRMEKGGREAAGRGCLSEALGGPGVSAPQPASPLPTQGLAWPSGMTDSNPRARDVVVSV